jgi:hypothetical protein
MVDPVCDGTLDPNAGLPRCQQCRRVLLDGKAEAWMEKGDIGDWISLELICSECAKDKHKSHEALKCQCNKCACRSNAVTVLCGFQSCAVCEDKHAVVLFDPQEDPSLEDYDCPGLDRTRPVGTDAVLPLGRRSRKPPRPGR